MRPQGRDENESLYFTYPAFQAPSQRDRLAANVAVAIVGAGPVGLTAALTLAKYGIASVVLEAKGTFNDGSRAICLARQSFHILESVGAVYPFLEKSLPYFSGRTFFRGQQILEFRMPDGPDHKYRPMYNLEQQYTEAYLYEAVAREPLIEMRWQSRVKAVQQNERGAVLSVEDPAGTYDLPAQWVLAADGARSAIRSMRGLRLKGQTYEGRYVIADIQMQRNPQGPGHSVERLALFDPQSRRGGTVLVHEQPDHIWRIDYQLREGESEADAMKEESIREGVAGVLRDLGWTQPWALEWWSIYSANTLALDDYRDGRIFYIGDSAHIVPIFGVRGLNNGLADAQNIGWKLASVLRGQGDEALLDSYTPERRGATLDVFANASKSARFMTPHSRGWALMRDAALSLSLRHTFAGEFANPRNMTPYTYADSPLTTPDHDTWRDGPVPGAVACNVRTAQGFLSDGFGPDFTLLVFGNASVGPARADLRVLRLLADGPEARAYGASDGAAYLVRPDMHVAARWHSVSADAVNNAMAQCLARACAAA